MENQLSDDLQSMHRENIKFLFEEYQALRREIEVKMKNTFWVYLTTFPIIGYAYYFLLQNPEKIPCRLLFFLPFIYLLVIAGMLFMMISQIKEIGTYIRQVEELLSPAGLGWETYLDNKNATPEIK